MNKDQLKNFEEIRNDYKKMRSEYQAQEIDRSLVPKKIIDFELNVLCLDLSRAGGILTNTFKRHGAVRCRESKQNGELDWWVGNPHDEQWELIVVLDIFLHVKS